MDKEKNLAERPHFLAASPPYCVLIFVKFFIKPFPSFPSDVLFE